MRLTRRSPDWAGIVDDLCLVLGAQFESGKGGKRSRVKGMVPMVRIRLELELVFEPGDRVLERGGFMLGLRS